MNKNALKIALTFLCDSRVTGKTITYQAINYEQGGKC